MGALVLGILALVLVACEGHHHDATAPEYAPHVTELTITPLSPLVEGHTAVYEFRAGFFDPDGDLDGGTCEIHTSIGSAEAPLSVADHGHPDATEGVAICLFETTVLGQVVSGTFTLTDRHGHGSSGVHFAVPAQRASGAARP